MLPPPQRDTEFNTQAWQHWFFLLSKKVVGITPPPQRDTEFNTQAWQHWFFLLSKKVL